MSNVGLPATSLTSRAEDTLRALFDGHASYVWLSLGRLGIAERDRDDLTSEVFSRVYRKLDSLDPTRPPRPWLFAFAVRVASEHRRRAHQQREVLTGAFESEASADDPEALASRAEASDILARAMESLSEERRVVFILHDLDEVPVPEIARALDIPEGTAYTRLRAARAEMATRVRRMMGMKGTAS